MSGAGVEVRVPCSTSNLGAGFDCVGLALNRVLRARFTPGDAPLRHHRTGTLETVADEDDLLARAFVRQCEKYGMRLPGGELHAHSEIPLGRGLGSSAAAVVAGLALAASVARIEPDRRALLQDAEAWEGHPDNVAPALFGGLVAATRDAAGTTLVMQPRLSPEIGFAFAAPGVTLATRSARAALPPDVPHALAARALGRVAALLEGLASADVELLRAAFADELHVPWRLPLIPGAMAAMRAAQDAGAWAVTISGAGSGLIALSALERSAAVAAAMGSVFARETDSAGVVAYPMEPDLEGTRIRVRAAA